MNCSYYKYCIVPQCKSTTIKTPNKLFIYVPNKREIRKKWLKLAGREDAHSLSTGSRMYFCEDHFDLPNDMINYMEYHIKGAVSQVRMNPGCMPSKFGCQVDGRKRTCSSTKLTYIPIKQRKMIKVEFLGESTESCTPNSSLTSDTSSNIETVGGNVPEMLCQQSTDKSVQVFVTKKFRSEAAQTDVKLIDQALSPLKHSLTSTITKSSPSELGLSEISKNVLIKEEPSDTDSSLNIPSVADNSPLLSMASLQVKLHNDCIELGKENKKIESKKAILNTIKKIEKKPRLYIGLPIKCYYLIDLIKDSINIPKSHLLFCLNKIRLDNKLKQLADDYGMTPSSLSEIFFKNIPLIASIMRPFIVDLDSAMIKKTLPLSFRHKYYNVSCIIDCLEIEVQKPPKAVNQALTWSEYRKANTIKYLVAYTPSGLVNYISPGFGGKITDACLVESCDFIKTLKSGMCVLADRGFENVEQYLNESGIALVRPPSVEKGVKISKTEAKLSKQIASFRIDIEKITRRLREFYMLRPHACVAFKFVKILDEIVIIACALINLQDSVIK